MRYIKYLDRIIYSAEKSLTEGSLILILILILNLIDINRLFDYSIDYLILFQMCVFNNIFLFFLLKCAIDLFC